jgi:hypothetical protein
MSKITSTKQLVEDDFPKEKGWSSLITTLNPFVTQAYYALVNGLTLRDNFKSQIYKFTLNKNTPLTQSFKWALNENPTSVHVAQIYNLLTGAAVPLYSFSWQMNQSGQVVMVFNGLLATDAYSITIVGQV